MRSSESMSDRPLSILSNGTAKSSSSKSSRFNFFNNKEKRHSISFSFSSKKSPLTSPTHSTFLSSNDFDDLLRSGNTKKVSLTPNRLRSIEVKEEVKTVENDSTPWERFKKTTPRTKKQHIRSTTPPPPLPPLPRFNSKEIIDVAAVTAVSPPLTPASSVASRPSQKSRHSIIYEERTSNKKSLDLPLESTKNTKEVEKSKPRFERPSSMVAKRASMGSRPPSFHENAFMDFNLFTSTTAGSVETNNKKLDEFKQQFEKRSQKQTKEPADMIYVIPSRTPTTITNGKRLSSHHSKSRAVDRACQTDLIPTHQEDDEEDEEWFIEEEDWEEDSEEEKSVAEWLLGNV